MPYPFQNTTKGLLAGTYMGCLAYHTRERLLWKQCP